MDWRNATAVDELRRYVEMRVPYPEIGRRLGTTTGAVCGKVSRLGIGKGPRGQGDRLFVTPTPASRQKKAPGLDAVVDPEFLAIMRRQRDEEKHRGDVTVLLDSSDDHHCRYIIGDPVQRRMCGASRDGTSPYCAKHKALCKAVPKERRISEEGRQAWRVMGFKRLADGYLARPHGAVSFLPVDTRSLDLIDPEPLRAAAGQS